MHQHCQERKIHEEGRKEMFYLTTHSTHKIYESMRAKASFARLLYLFILSCDYKVSTNQNYFKSERVQTSSVMPVLVIIRYSEQVLLETTTYLL